MAFELFFQLPARKGPDVIKIQLARPSLRFEVFPRNVQKTVYPAQIYISVAWFSAQNLKVSQMFTHSKSNLAGLRVKKPCSASWLLICRKAFRFAIPFNLRGWSCSLAPESERSSVGSLKRVTCGTKNHQVDSDKKKKSGTDDFQTITHNK